MTTITLLTLILALTLSLANLGLFIVLVRTYRELTRSIEKFARLWTKPVVESTPWADQWRKPKTEMADKQIVEAALEEAQTK